MRRHVFVCFRLIRLGRSHSSVEEGETRPDPHPARVRQSLGLDRREREDEGETTVKAAKAHV